MSNHHLPTPLRHQLARVIKEARRLAEDGARAALRALAVDRAEAYPSMSEAERALRRRLRAHGRQLGDLRDRRTGEQGIRRLAHELAYEHWHRMLFARFLAENGLLIEPEHRVPVTLEECRELALEVGRDPWELAAGYARRMLPRIFRADDPVLEVTLAPEIRHGLERLLESLPAEVFTADDALGWTYQFWQAEAKEAVNAAGVKIGADELPAVTQLFTEGYMVRFLYHNTIGAWRAGKILAGNPELAEGAGGEDELRRAVRLSALGGYEFSFLRFVREPREGEGEPTGPWRPAAGTFPGWPCSAAGLRVLDPCCGSGHFLVEGLEILVRLRMEEEGLGVAEAVRRVLAENLFGLEIDPRCTQIAAFNLALAAWRLAGGPMELPPLNIACSGLAPNAAKEEWLRLAEEAAAAGGMPASRDLHRREDSLLSARLREGLETLYELFQQAPVLGSLIDPTAVAGDLFRAGFSDLQSLLQPILEAEADGDDTREHAVAAQGMARAAELLAGRYTLIITNVPYLGRGDQSAALNSFAAQQHPEAKANLATVFVSRILGWLDNHGTLAVVTPQNWHLIASYADLRHTLLHEATFNFVVNLGLAAFRDMNWWAVNTALNVISRVKAPKDSLCAGLDLADHRLFDEKTRLVRSSPLVLLPQSDFAKRPDSRLVLSPLSGGVLLQRYAEGLQGIATADYEHFGRRFWEVHPLDPDWEFHQSTVRETMPFGGRENALLWEGGSGQLARSPSARVQGANGWGKLGVAVAQMRHLPVTLYTGELWDNNTAVILPRDPSVLLALWCYCTSPQFVDEVRRLDRKVNVTNATLVKVPFDLPHWQKVAAERYPFGLPEPQSNDPTQWLFHGHPAGMVAAGPEERSPFGIADPVGCERHPSLICREPNPGDVLQVAVARLLGYRWPAERDPEMELDPASRAWVERCAELLPFADADGIVCLPAVRGEAPAADRLRRLLAAALGQVWSPETERRLLAAAAEARGTRPVGSLEEWLRDRFFEEHCKLFAHRPFVWHVWDGRKDGFSALVNSHRLAGPDGEGRRTLESLTYSYLGDWIARQKAALARGEDGAEGRLLAAQDLQAQLEKILEGEPPLDLFIRWKPLAAQPIGWDPDIDDGVRLNIRPFMRAELEKGGRKGAGVLRFKPNIKWGKDRGKEPQSLRPKEDYPWFWSCPGDGTTDFPGKETYDGNRWNDLHYTNEMKRRAREHASKGEAR